MFTGHSGWWKTITIVKIWTQKIANLGHPMFRLSHQKTARTITCSFTEAGLIPIYEKLGIKMTKEDIQIIVLLA